MEIMKLLEEINKLGTTVIVVTHSQEIVDRMKKRVIMMDRGTIVSDEKKAVIRMRISTFWYCLKQGVINICRNILFSLASIATVSACIFLFCLFFSIMVNVQYVVKKYGEHSRNYCIFLTKVLIKTRSLRLAMRLNNEKK